MSNPQTPAPRYLSIDAAAESLGCNPRTIRRYIAAGRLPAARVGNRLIRIKSVDVDALLRPIPTGGDAA